jgi:FkbM family methyltransferase
MNVQASLFRFANKLYERCYPAYHPLYRVYKAWTDRMERRMLRSLVQPGMTVVDIGANIGVYTRFLSHLAGPGGSVHAFEPAPDNFRHLQANVRGLRNVHARQAAAGDESKTVRLYLSSELNVDHRTFDGGDGRSAVDVPMLRLDDCFPPGQKVDFIKIDVQGFELGVLQGAERVFRDNAHLQVLMEFWPYGLAKAGVAPGQLFAWFLAQGLEASRVGGEEASPFDPSGFDPADINDYCNLLIRRRANG